MRTSDFAPLLAHMRMENEALRGWGWPALTAAKAAILAGIHVVDTMGAQTASAETVKEGSYYGHHDVVTAGDLAAQEVIIDFLGREHTTPFRVLTEEKPGTPQPYIITPDQLELVMRGPCYVIDPIDGTSQFKRGLPNWAVSVGVMNDGAHIGGAIFCRSLLDGFLIGGELGEHVPPVYVQGGNPTPHEGKIVERPMKECLIWTGVDFYTAKFWPHFKDFVQPIHDMARQAISAPSCATALAMLAAGKIDAVVEPVQAPWDWAAGYPLVLAAGGKFQFYRYDAHGVDLLDHPDLASYKKGGVAFIAGAPEIVDELTTHLRMTYRS